MCILVLVYICWRADQSARAAFRFRIEQLVVENKNALVDLTQYIKTQPVKLFSRRRRKKKVPTSY
jgi:hypothetical protein